MFRLTREVRFAINDRADSQPDDPPANGYAGYPSLTGFGHFFTLAITLTGELDERSSYLRNIKDIDAVARRVAIPFIGPMVQSSGLRRTQADFSMPAILLEMLRDQWPGASLHEVRLGLSPFLFIRCLASEHPMVRLSQKFEFAASHRLHNPKMSDAENRKTYGKCNNPHGHGHNYELEVALAGDPNESGLLIDVPALERIVAETVIERFDHKNLNLEVAEFAELIPSVENIARVIHGLLKPKLAAAGAKLAGVTVWETSKTWCEYADE